ncbi:hypothetical protein [Parasitella parasitica]|uniref:RING-type domain-containing protein n=1 Tax=Parasitella parasitica TaxID=35722 RepID=A0A0B7N0K3_9FUNG|nr:hypothetical protein [Parasitella parasitica]
MASPSKNQHHSHHEQPRKRSKVSRRELDTLNDDNRAHRDLPKCPICEYRIEPAYWTEHYQYELNRLSEPTSEVYSNPMNKNYGKRGAAVAARRQMEGKGKKKVSVHQEALDKVQKNRSKRKDRLRQIVDPVSLDLDDSHRVALELQQQEDISADVQTCFICQQRLYGDLDDINLHIDNCLSHPASNSRQEESEPDDQEQEQEQEQEQDTWQEYEWAGQVRVRASAMMEGGYGGAGFTTASKIEVDDQDDLDLDVEDDDAAQFGETQYTERDIVVTMDENNENESALREMVSGGSVRTPTLEEERQVSCSALLYVVYRMLIDRLIYSQEQAQEFEPTVSVSGWDQHLKHESHYTNPSQKQSSLVIDSLKARIRELESASKSSNCLICLESYKTPLTSIVCWHVHCEQCWLHTLGTKKLCPQCQKITTPADLRRIYL